MRFDNTLLRGLVLGAAVFMVQSTRAASVSFVGYSGDPSDKPTITPGTLDGTAGNARSDFLTVLGQKYYYEDFQEFSGFKNSGSLAISSSGLNLTFKPNNSPSYAGPVTATLTSTDATKNSDYADVQLHQGAIGTDTRGAFDTFEPGLDDAIPSEGLTDTTNQFVDISNQGKSGSDYTVTIDISPGYDALGLMLNDVVQPSKTNVVVNFSDGTSETMGALNSSGKNPGTLSTNNTWFLGVVDTANTISSVTITEAADGDPIDLDNIYVGNILGANGQSVVPLPSTVMGGGALIGLMAIARRRSRIV
jgi:hypothetical protein